MGEDIFHKIAPLICDAHVHIGKFKDGLYFSPQEVCEKLKLLGIGKWLVSSTTTSDNDYEAVCKEISALIKLAPQQTLPLLWVTPQMVVESEDLSHYNAFPYHAIKIHQYADDWEGKEELLEQLMKTAGRKKLPVVIHTGGKPETDAGAYAELCAHFKDVAIVLAHGRPVDQTIAIMKKSEKVYVDTSFMPMPEIRRIVRKLGSDRILFGTDFPLDSYFYPNQSLTSRYKRRVSNLIRIFGQDVFIKWSNENFKRLFENE